MQITQHEADEVGINREVYQRWYDLMQALWTASISFFHLTGEQERLFPVQKDNEIFIGERFKINANMVNNSYVSAHLYDDETKPCEIRFTNDVNPVCQCIFIIFKNAI